MSALIKTNESCVETLVDNLTAYCSELEQANVSDSDLLFYIYVYKIATPVLFALIIFTGLIGNSLVVCVTLTQKRMRTTVNLFLLNLAFSDLTFLVVCVPFIAYHYAADNWLIGDAVCKLSQYIFYVTVYVTVYTLVSISVARFLHVVCAHREIRLRQFISGVVGAIWVTMLTTNVPILFIYRVKSVRHGQSDTYYYCGMENHDVNGRRLFISFFVLTYLAPLTTIATMYVLILRYLDRKQRRSSLRQQRKSSEAADGTTRRNSYATRISLAIVIVFGACWLPLHIHLLIVYYGIQPTSRFYQVFRVLCHVVAYSNSCMNPFIYHYVSTDFRQGLRNLFPAVCRRQCGRSRAQLCHQDTVTRYPTRQGDTKDWSQ